MANLTQLRIAAREMFDEAIRAVDTGEAVRRAVQFNRTTISIGDLEVSNRFIYAIAVGKAALAMAAALDETLGDSLTGGLLVAPQRQAFDYQIPLAKPWFCLTAGHPLPARDSLLAAQSAFELLDRANSEHALVIFLISGGGSAMMEWPIDDGITLGDIRVANKALIASGASIGEINAVRRMYSFVKGGRLAEKAQNCDQITLIVSDVPAGQEWNVASGPTLPPPANAPDAREIVARYHLREQLPASIVRAIDSAEAPADHFAASPKVRKHLVILDNDDAVEAAAGAARSRGFTGDIARDISDNPIDAGVKKLLTRIADLKQADGVACLISGGEFACPVRGEGIGGRNLETALRLAIDAEKSPRLGHFVALCAGTDGIDGNSPATGAIVDSTTLERARRIGLDPIDFLSRSDAYSFFVALGDAITTGATGTNVRDLRILLVGGGDSNP